MTTNLLAASVLGRDHLLREANAQDAFAVRAGARPGGKPFAVGVVADGCGSEARSEVGAALLAFATGEWAARRLANGARAADVAHGAIAHAKAALRTVVHATARDDEARRELVRSHLCATLLLLVDDGDEVVIVARGDGLVVIGDEVTVLDRDGAPDYVAFDLFDRPSDAWTTVLRSADAPRVAVATDGLDRSLASGLWGHRGRSLQRWLNVEARRVPLRDDATVVVREREEATSW